MTSPFPGIDPYIEDQGYRPDFHSRFITYACDAISDRLPRPYEAVIDEQFRLYEFETTEDRVRAIEPDIAVVQVPRRGGGSVAAVAEDVELCEPVEVPLPTLEELRYTWIEIRKRPDRQLVTVLELLTQMNKSGQGRAEYEAKRRRLWSLSVHLVELDFLLAGPRMPLGGPLPPGDFYAYVTRGDGRSMCQVFAWSIRGRLPTIPLPLLPPDPDVPLDLAAVYATAHQRGRYRERLDYRAALGLPLAPEARSWLENQARTAVG